MSAGTKLSDLQRGLCVRWHKLRRPSGRDNGVLYDDLLIEVLCRLPPRHLMRCSCVCKGWRRLIVRVCQRRVTPSLPLLGIDVISYKKRAIGRALIPQPAAADSTSEDSINTDFWPPVIYTDDPTFVLVGYLFNFCPGVEDLLDSCNGLMLFKHTSNTKTKYIVWNHTTRQFHLSSSSPWREPALFAALAIDQWYYYDIIICSFRKPVGRVQYIDLFSAKKRKWTAHKVQYSPAVYPAAALVDSCIYLRGRLFRLSRSGLLLWYNVNAGIGDSDSVIIYDHIKLPNADSWNRRRLGCIGSCMGRLHYAWRDDYLRTMQIWELSVGTREWTLRHSIKLQTLASHYQLVGSLHSTFPAPPNPIFQPLTFDPVSDAIIIWTPNRIFCYNWNSGNLVLLQCSNFSTDALKHSPHRAFPSTRCLTPLVIIPRRRD